LRIGDQVLGIACHLLLVRASPFLFLLGFWQGCEGRLVVGFQVIHQPGSAPGLDETQVA
jgi:hypothetical protein